jgi:FkbM family methyltransferase
MSLKFTLFKLLKSTINLGFSLFGENNKNLGLSKLAEELPPVYTQDTKFGKISFFCIGELALYRAQSLLTKEPETLEWIDSFGENDVLFDIGANVGCYSLYAAKKNISVIAFEPSAANYFLLNKNIEINKLFNKVQAFCLAFDESSRTGFLHMPTTQLGGAINTFGKESEDFSFMGDSWNVKYKQGMISFSVDDFIHFYHLNPPTHIKIDVDGIEEQILRGAKNTLSDNNVKSLLVELDTSQPHYDEIVAGIAQFGFKLHAKKHAAIFDTGMYKSVYNHIFVKSL